MSASWKPSRRPTWTGSAPGVDLNVQGEERLTAARLRKAESRDEAG